MTGEEHEAQIWLSAGAPHLVSWPERTGFNFAAGAAIQPEFTALLVGLVAYFAAFIAVIVRPASFRSAKARLKPPQPSD